MSASIQERARELVWRQWTVLGVAGVVEAPEQGVDLEALIAFTPFVAEGDPRLHQECVDWCLRVGHSFISISRLRQIVKLMPVVDIAETLPNIVLGDVEPSSRRTGKSRLPMLGHPALLQLRSRYVFGVGARADIISKLVTRSRSAGAQRLSAITPTGYTKQAVASALDQLAQASVLQKLVRRKAVTYRVLKDGPLRALIEPLPKRLPSWAERFAIVANILVTWTRYGARSTYAIELAKALDTLRPVAAALGERPPTVGRRKQLLRRVDHWASALLDDAVWDNSWIYDADDIAYEILTALYDDLVQTVHSGDYPVGYVELEDLAFRNVDRKAGTAEFHVAFSAEHHREDFDFVGYVEGSLRFDADVEGKQEFLESFAIDQAEARFDMGDPE